MKSYYEDPLATLYQGDCREVLRELPAESVQCAVTSPPYWGLRDYGVDGQLGLEPTPDEYVAAMVEIFREVRRVLRADGTLWLNMGDSYFGSGGAGGDYNGGGLREGQPKWKQGGKHTDREHQASRNGHRARAREMHLKPKDLIGIPWRLAFALQADGWWLRKDIIWSKPNPMPESVTDRPTSAHEYVFLMTKAARYFYDADAIREPAEYGRRDWSVQQFKGGDIRVGHGKDGGSVTGGDPSAGRNKRSVWEIATAPYSEAHFATYPPALVRPCIMAGTSERGACAECGAPYERVVVRVDNGRGQRGYIPSDSRSIGGPQRSGPGSGALSIQTETTGWQPTCAHDGEPIPCTVLDPFAGSATTLQVAKELHRHGIGIELSADYCAIAVKRITSAHVGMAL